MIYDQRGLYQQKSFSYHPANKLEKKRKDELNFLESPGLPRFIKYDWNLWSKILTLLLSLRGSELQSVWQISGVVDLLFFLCWKEGEKRIRELHEWRHLTSLALRFNTSFTGCRRTSAEWFLRASCLALAPVTFHCYSQDPCTLPNPTFFPWNTLASAASSSLFYRPSTPRAGPHVSLVPLI